MHKSLMIAERVQKFVKKCHETVKLSPGKWKYIGRHYLIDDTYIFNMYSKANK